MSNNYRTLIKNKNKIDRIIKNIQSNFPVNETDVISIAHNANQNTRTFLVNRKASSDVAPKTLSTLEIGYIPRMFTDYYYNNGYNVINLASYKKIISNNELKKIFNNKYKHFEVIDNKLLGFDQNTYNMNIVGYSYGNDGHKDLSLTQFFSDLDYNYLADMYIANECNADKLSDNTYYSTINSNLPSYSYSQPILYDSDGNTDIKLFIGNYNHGIRCNKAESANLVYDFSGLNMGASLNVDFGRTRTEKLFYAAGPIIEKNCVNTKGYNNNFYPFMGDYQRFTFKNTSGVDTEFTFDELAFGLTGGNTTLYQYNHIRTKYPSDMQGIGNYQDGYGYELSIANFNPNLFNTYFHFYKCSAYNDNNFVSPQIAGNQIGELPVDNTAAMVAGLIYNTLMNRPQMLISYKVPSTDFISFFPNSTNSYSKTFQYNESHFGVLKTGSKTIKQFINYGKINNSNPGFNTETIQTASHTYITVKSSVKDSDIQGDINIEDTYFMTLFEQNCFTATTSILLESRNDINLHKHAKNICNSIRTNLWSKIDYQNYYNTKITDISKQILKYSVPEFIYMNTDKDFTFTSVRNTCEPRLNFRLVSKPIIALNDLHTLNGQFTGPAELAIDLSDFKMQFRDELNMVSRIQININPYTFNNYVYDNINTKISNLCQYNNISDKSKIDFINKYKDKHFYNNQLRTKVSYLKNNDNTFNTTTLIHGSYNYDVHDDNIATKGCDTFVNINTDGVELASARIDKFQAMLTSHLNFADALLYRKDMGIDNAISEKWIDPLGQTLLNELNNLEAELRGLG